MIRDFHPLVFFYALGILMTFAGLALGVLETVLRIDGHAIPAATVVLVALLLIAGSQFTLFAMWFDMESNRDDLGEAARDAEVLRFPGLPVHLVSNRSPSSRSHDESAAPVHADSDGVDVAPIRLVYFPSLARPGFGGSGKREGA